MLIACVAQDQGDAAIQLDQPNRLVLVLAMTGPTIRVTRIRGVTDPMTTTLLKGDGATGIVPDDLRVPGEPEVVPRSSDYSARDPELQEGGADWREEWNMV